MLNLHATAVVLGDRGVAILGASGSGKTALALTLIRRCRADGRFARLVADDQIFVTAAGGRVIAHAPPTILGLAEFRGLGPRPTPAEPRAAIDLAVRLVAGAPRIHAGEFEQIAGVGLPRLDLAERDSAASARAVEAWLGPGS